MDSMQSGSRRKLLGLAAAGAALGTLGARESVAQAQRGQQPVSPAPPKFTSWVHGHSAVLERGIFSATRSGVDEAFPTRDWDGDLIRFPKHGALALSRIGWGARFVIFDYGTGAANRLAPRPKNGEVWCHYAIPTPFVGADDQQALRLDKVTVMHTAPTPEQLSVTAVDVWDGDTLVQGSGRLPTTDPASSAVFSLSLPSRAVKRGLGVSLLITANQAINTYLEVHGVGIRFKIQPDASRTQPIRQQQSAR